MEADKAQTGQVCEPQFQALGRVLYLVYGSDSKPVRVLCSVAKDRVRVAK